ncbi:hypothetical protein ACQKMI_06735 [Lysinibacillus sp. NPDC097214]|uniref:hypothetical protein n=1 Tax=Lysinibacillus sp. NPDC097214 TaxID=3390584 RepID=UPI003CFD37C8
MDWQSKKSRIWSRSPPPSTSFAIKLKPNEIGATKALIAKPIPMRRNDQPFFLTLTHAITMKKDANTAPEIL